MTDPGPYDLNDVRLVMGPNGVASPREVCSDFYAALDRDFASFAGHTLIAQHAFTKPWPSWEVHPAGDEFVFLVSGDIDFVVWQDGAESVLRLNQPGSYVVVPKAVWHTGRPRNPSTLLFVTPGEGTINADTPYPLAAG